MFRGLHSGIFMGTASDRYAGWIGQIYSEKRFGRRISRRTKTVGGKAFIEEVLPVESVEEYFRHFPILELDFTFYRPLIDGHGEPTTNLHVLRTYAQHLGKEDRLILKVPQRVFSKKIRKGKAHVINEDYLNPDIFIHQFYEPATRIVGPWLEAFVFEQEYQRKEERPSTQAFAGDLDTFFGAIPKDTRYHVEIRTESLLTDALFQVLETHGVGQVLSHWTWLPSLARQHALSGQRFFNGSQRLVIRLMTPRRVKYEDAYARAHPFNTLVEGMLDRQMLKDTVVLTQKAIEEKVRTDLIINNRAGGNAPLIAREVAKQFMGDHGTPAP